MIEFKLNKTRIIGKVYYLLFELHLTRRKFDIRATYKQDQRQLRTRDGPSFKNVEVNSIIFRPLHCLGTEDFI